MSDTVLTHPRSYYDRSKAEWTVEELEQVKKEYESDQMSIIDIGNSHKRTPGGISYRLKKLGIITNTTEARGYEEYKNSLLYSEIVTEYKDKRNKKTGSVAPTSTPNDTEPMKTHTQYNKDILQELRDIKQLLKVIVEKLSR